MEGMATTWFCCSPSTPRDLASWKMADFRSLRKLIGSSMMNLPSCGLALVTWATFTAGLKVSCWEDWSEVELWLLKESLGRNLEEEVCVGTGRDFRLATILASSPLVSRQRTRSCRKPEPGG